jgi:hypothetical protein
LPAQKLGLAPIDLVELQAIDRLLPVHHAQVISCQKRTALRPVFLISSMFHRRESS